MSSPSFVAKATTGPGTIRYELTFLNVFRVIQAVVYTGLAFGMTPVDGLDLGSRDFARDVAISYMLFALFMLLLNRVSMPHAKTAVSAMLVVDVVAAVLAIVTMHDARIGIAMMLAVNLSVGALMLPFTAEICLDRIGYLSLYSMEEFDNMAPPKAD